MFWIFAASLSVGYAACWIVNEILEHRRRALKIGEFSENAEETE